MLVQLEHVRKKYGSFTLELNMQIPEDRIIGLIGANGAGKSTTFKLMLGLIRPDQGTVEVLGRNAADLGAEEKLEIGAVFSDSGFSEYLKVQQLIPVMSRFYPDFQEKEFRERCERFQIPLNKQIKEFSTGMKAKLTVLTATSFDARLLVLDEPTAGLDPRGRDEVLDQVSALQRSRGITVILVSHSMEDVAKYVDRLIVMNQGEVRFDGRPVEVFHHYKELEEIGLAAPQTTYLMQELKKQGADVNTDATTVEEAADAIEAWLKASK